MVDKMADETPLVRIFFGIALIAAEAGSADAKAGQGCRGLIVPSVTA